MAPRVDQKKIAKYFDLLNDKAVCKLCSHVLKRDRLFNLKTHILRVHQIIDEDFKNEVNGPSLSTSSTAKVYKNQAVKIDISKRNFIRSYIGLVTEDSIPFSVLSSENFKNIINPICLGLSDKYGKEFSMNSNKCEETLKEAAENIRDAIKTELNDRLLSLKLDSATRLARNVFAVSAQFIKNDKIQSHILGMFELQSADTSSLGDLGMKILNLLGKYDINLDQVISFASDNLASIIKSTETLSLRSIFEDRQDGYEVDDRNETYLEHARMFEGLSKLPLDNVQITCCVAYTAQLCALEVIKNPEIKDFLFSCRNLVKFFRTPSNGFWEIFELRCLPMPQLDCPLKWGSTFSMISALSDAKPILPKIESIEDKTPDENYVVNDAFWQFVEAYCVVFDPLQYTILKFQQEQLHYGNFYAEWLKCKICTEKLIDKDERTYVKKIGKRLLHSIESKTAQLLKNESLLSCLYLDPRFTHTLTAAQKRDAVSYLTKLYDRIKRVMVDTPNNSSSRAEIFMYTTSESPEFTKKEDEYLNEYLTQKLDNAANESINLSTKIENLQLPFLRVDSNVLHFWRDRQQTDVELHALSNICFAIPATQVKNDRVFSSLKLILNNNRNQMTMDTLENILLVKLNPTYLDELIENSPLHEEQENTLRVKMIKNRIRNKYKHKKQLASTEPSVQPRFSATRASKLKFDLQD